MSGPGGFQANILTNEPGTKSENPADVTINAEPSPAGLQEMYTPTSGLGK